MMNTKVKLLLTIIWCHLLPVLSAQEMINVRHYSIEDGLSQNIVQDMLQDNDGYIWLATWNGLEKFDGYTFKNYKSYPTDDTKLKYNRLVSIVTKIRKTFGFPRSRARSHGALPLVYASHINRQNSMLTLPSRTLYH